MNNKGVGAIIAVLVIIGAALWHTPLKFLSLVWVWLLIGIPGQLAACRV